MPRTKKCVFAKFQVFHPPQGGLSIFVILFFGSKLIPECSVMKGMEPNRKTSVLLKSLT